MSKLKGAVCDARCQQFHRECESKKEKLKTKWFLRNQQRLYDNLAKQKFSQKAIKAAQQKQRVVDKKTPAALVRQQILPSWRPAGAEVFNLMKPIKPEILNILYVPKDESFISKKNYLAQRYKEKPEDRYYYPYCASWDFGWRLKDYPPSSVSVYGVRSVIQSSFYRRNASSLQRDPDWYRMCQTGDPKNFNEILTY